MLLLMSVVSYFSFSSSYFCTLLNSIWLHRMGTKVSSLFSVVFLKKQQQGKKYKKKNKTRREKLIGWASSNKGAQFADDNYFHRHIFFCYPSRCFVAKCTHFCTHCVGSRLF